MQRSNVDLPVPEEPITTMVSPRRTSRLHWRRDVAVAPALGNLIDADHVANAR